MSRIGIKPIKYSSNIKVEISKGGKFDGNIVKISGPLGSLSLDMRKEIKIKLENSEIILERVNDEKKTKSLHGLYRSLIQNMVIGVEKGYEKQLEVVGMGYKIEIKNDNLEIKAGKTHPMIVKKIEGIQFEVFDKTKLKVRGIDKELVGNVAASIRNLAKPDSYKGKGIRYIGEKIRQKVGKQATKESK